MTLVICMLNKMFMFKLDTRKVVNISFFGQNECLEICAIFFRDGVEGMMKNASCFMVLFHVNK